MARRSEWMCNQVLMQDLYFTEVSTSVSQDGNVLLPKVQLSFALRIIMDSERNNTQVALQHNLMLTFMVE